MTVNESRLPFFTPIFVKDIPTESKNRHYFRNLIENYFNWTNQYARPINDHEVEILPLPSYTNKFQKIFFTSLKVLSYLTLVIPIIMAIAKGILRITQPGYKVKTVEVKKEFSLQDNYEKNVVDLSYIEYNEAKRPNAPTLLMIHGMDSSKEAWQSVLGKLKNDYRILAIDLRGHGDSPFGNFDLSLPQHVADIDAFVKKHQLEKFHIVGHSAGVRMGLCYYAAHPEKVEALILEDMEIVPREDPNCSPETVEHYKKFQQTHPTFEALEREMTKYGYGRKISSWLSQGKIRRQPDGSYRVGNHPYASYCLQKYVNTSSAFHTAFEQLAKQKKPTLLLKAEFDSSISDAGLAEMRQLFPQMLFQEIKGSDHSIHKSSTSDFLNAINSFIDSKVKS